MEGEFIQISLILLVVIGVAFIGKLLKQPPIIGYIVSGIIVGPVFLNIMTQNSVFSLFAELGIAFLLFIIGMHLSPKVIKEVGKISLIAGVGEVVITFILFECLTYLFGFDLLSSIYISVAIAFTSTIVVMKFLADKDALDKLFSKISIGILLIEDVIAIFVLIFISSFENSADIYSSMGILLFKGVLIFLLLVPINKYVLPKVNDFFAESSELLFLFSIALGLGMASLFYFAGFSLEIGALIAGVMLSFSDYSYEISSKLRPLRDFFIVSFFVLLGSRMVFSDIKDLILPIIIFSILILILKPLVVMTVLGLNGYSKKTGFYAGISFGQISEFSLIIISIAVAMGQIEPKISSFITAIGLITISGSIYFMMYADKIYARFSKILDKFERRKLVEEKALQEKYEYFLFGENRIGFSIMKTFRALNKPYLVVDFNPERIAKLHRLGIPCVYGDVSDDTFLEELKLENAKIIVSTIPDYEANLAILKRVKHFNRDAVTIVTARHISEAMVLYKAGADYVILPHFLGGEYVSKLIEEGKNKKEFYAEEKDKQIKNLKERFKDGQEHPEVDRK